jgi:hypothetical protein
VSEPDVALERAWRLHYAEERIAELEAALDTLAARLEAAEQALRQIADTKGLLKNADHRGPVMPFEIARAALARQPSQERA